MEKLAEELKQEEGLVLKVYRCSKGFLTMGYGHRCEEGDPISLDAAEALLKFDIARTVSSFYRIPHHRTRNLNENRRRVICQMIFQLGLNGTLGFRRMWLAIERGDFDAAADEMLDSAWYRRDTPARAMRLSQIMRHGG